MNKRAKSKIIRGKDMVSVTEREIMGVLEDKRRFTPALQIGGILELVEKKRESMNAVRFTEQQEPNLLDQLLIAYLEKNMPDRPYKIGTYYPSELPYCLRREYFRYTSPKDLTPQRRKLFGVGWLWHQFFYTVLKAGGKIKILNIEKEYKLKHPDKDLFLLCIPDVEAEINGQRVIIEIKSAKGLGRITEASREDVLQVTPYMAVTKIRNAMLFYVNKQTLETKDFPIRFEPENLTLVFERAKRLHEALQSKSLPPRVGAGQDWQCEQCEYETECETFAVVESEKRTEGGF